MLAWNGRHSCATAGAGDHCRRGAAEHGEPCKPHGTRRVIPHGASPHPRLAGILPTACASIFAGTSLTGRASGTLVRRYTSCCERGSGGTSFQVLARLGPTKTVCYWPGLEGSGLHSPFGVSSLEPYLSIFHRICAVPSGAVGRASLASLRGTTIARGQAIIVMKHNEAARNHQRHRRCHSHSGEAIGNRRGVHRKRPSSPDVVVVEIPGGGA